MKTYFFDSYAFFELIEGNPRYRPYAKGIAIITTKLNLMELHFGLLKKFGKKAADANYHALLPYAIDFSDEEIMTANGFKIMNWKKNLSYVDCLGYTIARARGIPFLTGDSQFKGVEGVEFVE